MIELGSKVRDIVSDFEGTAVGRTEWLTGCVQWIVAPKGIDKDGKRRDNEWFDEMRLEVIEAPAQQLVEARAARSSDGGPQDVPRSRIGG